MVEPRKANNRRPPPGMARSSSKSPQTASICRPGTPRCPARGPRRLSEHTGVDVERDEPRQRSGVAQAFSSIRVFRGAAAQFDEGVRRWPPRWPMPGPQDLRLGPGRVVLRQPGDPVEQPHCPPSRRTIWAATISGLPQSVAGRRARKARRRRRRDSSTVNPITILQRVMRHRPRRSPSTRWRSGMSANRDGRRRVRWRAPRRRRVPAPRGCPQVVASSREPLVARMFSRARDRRRRLHGDGVAEASSPALEDQRRKAALSTVDSALGDNSTARSTIPLWDSSQCRRERGRRVASIGMPTVAERTAATTQPLCAAQRGATEANEASPSNMVCAAAPPARLRPSKMPTPQPSALSRPLTSAGAAHDCNQQPARRSSTSDAPIPAHPASPGGGTSGVPGQAHTGEDLAPDRVVPVAEAGPQDVRADGPGTAAQAPL